MSRSDRSRPYRLTVPGPGTPDTPVVAAPTVESMWPLFRPFPVIGDVRLSLRDIVAAGLTRAAGAGGRPEVRLAGTRPRLRERDRERLESWDRRGFICPLAFVRGGWTNWASTDPYPLDGIEFREENGFRPWAEYEFEREGFSDVTALYAEWQLLYLPIAKEADITGVPSEVLLSGGDLLVEWAEKTRWFVEANSMAGGVMDERWLPTIKALLRLQARYWPL
jgi:hypothetical protein